MSKPRLLGSQGRRRPSKDNEQMINELRARIQKTVAFAESVKERSTRGRERSQGQTLLGARQGHRRRGLPAADDIPNTFFHIAMAYAILRHNGVDVGKMDFLGPINLVD